MPPPTFNLHGGVRNPSTRFVPGPSTQPATVDDLLKQYYASYDGLDALDISQDGGGTAQYMQGRIPGYSGHQPGRSDVRGASAYRVNRADYKVTTTGYKSDVHNDKKSFSNRFAHEYNKSVTKFYKVDPSFPELGRGAWGVVQVVRKLDETADTFAMKTVDTKKINAYTREKLKREIQVQSQLTHPNICRLYESFWEPDGSKLHVVMELCTGGTLINRLARNVQRQKFTHGHVAFDENAAAGLMQKMLSAVLYCHHNGVIHRDIKLENFIFENEREDAQIKLIDFGLAMQVASGQEGMNIKVGTPTYMAPELWDDGSTLGYTASTYDSSVDVWALGIVAYQLLSGKPPFFHPDRGVMKRMVQKQALEFPKTAWQHISADAKDFCRRMLEKAPCHRPNCTEALKHPWIRKAAFAGPASQAALAKSADIVQSLASFAAADDMKKLALESVAFAMPAEKVEKLRELFYAMDEDASGTLSFEEFDRAMMASGQQLDPDTVDKMYRSMDINGSGEVDYLEFLSAAVASQGNIDDRMSTRAAFSLLDHDSDGFINESDLNATCSDFLSPADIKKLIATKGKDGRIDFEAFKVLMLSDEGALIYRAAQKFSEGARVVVDGGRVGTIRAIHQDDMGNLMHEVSFDGGGQREMFGAGSLSDMAPAAR